MASYAIAGLDATEWDGHLALNSGATNGLVIYRIEFYYPAATVFTATMVRYQTGDATGGGVRNIFPFADTAPLVPVAGRGQRRAGGTVCLAQTANKALVLPSGPGQRCGTWAPGSTVGRFPVDLEPNPISVAQGHCIALTCTPEPGTLTLFFRE